MSMECIRLRRVRQNNLKGFNLDIPLGKLVVVTGLSGTGKSSLVFDTLHAEGQRRYVETFSPYARQFLELLPRPAVDSIENIRPSIALRQGNTVRTSRSTVGTMTELCDHFKNWFPHVAQLHDPVTGKILQHDNPQSIWKHGLKHHKGKRVLLTFEVKGGAKLGWEQALATLREKGYARVFHQQRVVRIEDLEAQALDDTLEVIQDRLVVATHTRARFIEACTSALHHGHGQMHIVCESDHARETFNEALHSTHSGETFAPAKPALFSFNSPLGACPRCRGFGRVIEMDERLVVPDPSLSLNEGAIRPFQGEVYQESLRDLAQFASALDIPMDVPWEQLTHTQQRLVFDGDPHYSRNGKEWPHAWYGVRRFFDYLESKAYKMHVRVFLSKYRAYTRCPDCQGSRLRREALHWKWKGHTLPELYAMTVNQLARFLRNAQRLDAPRHEPQQLALNAILARLGFLNAVGLGYLSLDRASRTLSGGEVERVNLTACLGSSLVETLFVLDEPSVGLHASDVERLIAILRRLCDQGNTVIVVEHDETIMRAADHLIELGPEPGQGGGQLVFSGSPNALGIEKTGISGDYLSGRRTIPIPNQRRPVQLPSVRIKKTDTLCLRLRGAHKHNLRGLNLDLPLGRFVALSGVSGSGKSTLLDNVLHQGLAQQRGESVEDPAFTHSLKCPIPFEEVILVDQSPLSKTPRSNPALYTEAWKFIRECFASTPEAQAHELSASYFSFNSSLGRCPHCEGLGSEKVEMQFLSEVYVPCPVCEGQRFRPEILECTYRGKSINDVLAMTVEEAVAFFANDPKILRQLEPLPRLGLGYLRMGQPLNTLSGGEAQRLKLVRYLRHMRHEKPSLLLIDEPTTGLHRHDIGNLLAIFQHLVDNGHSLVLIEHQLDVLKSADWIIELGPGAGKDGGKLVFQGTPETLALTDTPTASFLREALETKEPSYLYPENGYCSLEAAESTTPFVIHEKPTAIELIGAREHNLKNLSLTLRRKSLTVVTGVSGSGKSTLAFDILFAEGQRRFMESVSAYARQFVEQMPRPDIDQLAGIPPTVAIEQRITRGTRKSTVATITEVAQYLRLLYARLGIQHSPHNDAPVVTQSLDALALNLGKWLASESRSAYLCAPLVRGRKGHHQPLADWAREHGYDCLRCDGKLVRIEAFKPLDRYREHDVEVVTATFKDELPKHKALRALLDKTLALGKGSAFLLNTKGHTHWLSTARTDPLTGEAYPELDPKHFSWNSPKGWCPSCHGTGETDAGTTCPACNGARLNPLSRAVKLHFKKGSPLSLPELLKLAPKDLIEITSQLKLDARGQAIAQDLLPPIRERLAFLNAVGLDYLSLDRPTATLSGGEAQRIRLAAQLGSNLAGVLYILDEPSIGLHARDNARLLDTLDHLKARGNTLVVVEHNAATMQRADCIVDLGPGAGTHGGELIANGSLKAILNHPNSLTGRYLKSGIVHPLRGNYRSLPVPFNPRSKRNDWLVLRGAHLHNLKGDELRLPLGRLNIVCGVSGSGKSTLIRHLLKPALEAAIKQKKTRLGGKGLRLPFAELLGTTLLDGVIEVDQEPIGKTPRSTPATYIGAFDLIRPFFAGLPEARMRGHTASTFSFNTRGGRCETCGGAGRVKVDMNFLPEAYVTCEDCGGTRYGSELEDIRWKGKNIAEVLEMSFEEAEAFFDFHTRLHAMCALMVETGLGYLQLGQSSPTLSGGEAQRLKLVSELVRGLPTFQQRQQGLSTPRLYLLEEPTIGLHASDCEKLIRLLHRLVDQGHTVVVIEHHTDIIAEADYVVELGPDGGDAGGHILYQGKLAGLAQCKGSPTAPFIRQHIHA